MDTRSSSSLLDSLLLYLPLPPLCQIVVAYSLPPSLSSYGISLGKVLTGKINVRMYFNFSIEHKITEDQTLSFRHGATGDEIAGLDILLAMKFILHKGDIIRYGIAPTNISIRRGIIAIDGIVEDPAIEAI